MYYTLGFTPAAERADWVRRDVGSTSWQVRRAVQGTTGLLLGVLIGAVLFGPRPGLIAGSIIGSMLAFIIQLAIIRLTFIGDYVRRRTLSSYEKRWSKKRSD